jgi:hypothetical protein
MTLFRLRMPLPGYSLLAGGGYMLNEALLRTTLQLMDESGLHDKGHWAIREVGKPASERYCFATLLVINTHPEAELVWFGDPD